MNMNRRGVLALPWLAALCTALPVVLWLAPRERRAEAPRGVLADHRDAPTVLRAEGAGEDGFLKVEAPREFSFPEDHGAHDGFRVEWWYFTGNLESPEGRRFGYQLTFFRSALGPGMPQRSGFFAANHAWMAHFTVSDVSGGLFHDFERFGREAADLAGVTPGARRLWLKDWSCEFDAAGEQVQLSAGEAGVEIRLRLTAHRPPVLQGDGGLSRKNAGVGNASYYYSVPRLSTEGTVVQGGRRFQVSGDSWLDREWSSGGLAPEQVGWDWFALQLDDGSDLMWYCLRRADGSTDPFNGGSLALGDGSVRRLSAGELTLEVDEHWLSPRSQVHYPSRWRLRGQGLELLVTPALADQELAGTFRYWEGAVDVRGSRDGRSVGGRGYVELVGYALDGATGSVRGLTRKP